MATINKTTAKYRVLIFSPNLSEFNSGCASSSSNRFFAILSNQLIVRPHKYYNLLGKI